VTRLRPAALVLALSLLAVGAAAAPAPELARDYARPQQAVDVGGGRRLNLFCLGAGEPTVLFESGGSDWSDTWALVQPLAARRTRACAYDRAGLGHSDPARLPRTPAAIVEDLHALVAEARLPTPLVLVGHSFGGFNVKLYAALYPQDVAGLVLVDPSEERAAERSRAFLTAKFGPALAARSELADDAFYRFLMERYRRCAELARRAPLDATSLDYRRCTDPVRPQLGPEIAAERARVQVTETYQAAQASEILNSVYADSRADPVYARLFRPRALGRRPVVVLTHGIYDPDDPLDAAGQAAGIFLHEQSARLSARGTHRVVPDTHHNIQLEKPEAIAQAIDEVLSALGPVIRR
jgi:pimeloyl-ACP methyl ester carboxylesterase